MDRLLDFSQPFDVPLFERTVNTFMQAGHPEHAQAHKAMMALKDSHQAWQVVDKILSEAVDGSTKFAGLQILEDTIKFRWKTLPADQRLGIRNYVTDKIIALSRDEETLAKEKLFVEKLDLVLVHILKQEWPQNWPSFVPELVGSAKTSESLCENNMHILCLLSEEVFDFSKEDMTAAKTKVMKASLNEQFKMIFELLNLILEHGVKPKLLTTTLQTLLRFLNWIPVGFIFETTLIDRLMNKFFPVAAFRNDALRCLTEIGSLTQDVEPYSLQLVTLFNTLVARLEQSMLPLSVDISKEYERVKEGDKEFVSGLSLFFSGFFGAHLALLERPENHESLLKGMQYLIGISDVDDQEIFKTCLDAWTRLSIDLYSTECAPYTQMVVHATGGAMGGGGALTQNRSGSGGGGFRHNFGALNGGANSPELDDEDDNDPDDAALFVYGRGRPVAPVTSALSNNLPSPRKQLYSRVLSALRYLLISHMAKPEEVLVKVDENGEVVREHTKDTDAVALYKQIRDTLVYLTHLDVHDTEAIMLARLSQQSDENRNEYSAQAINTLSWAIGSISGTMDETTEKQFLVAVIRDLLVLCEMKSGKDNKALIASDIMYVVGQYPRFLRMHWRFLKTVVTKLFEFMHEPHPGVQDMACDTFLKLMMKCKRKFVQLQTGESSPFIDTLLGNLSTITSDLEQHQVYSFYESVGVILSSAVDAKEREMYLARLMEHPNHQWRQIMLDANTNVETLYDETRIKDTVKVLKLNIHVAKATGHTYLSQLGIIHMDMLNVYKLFSEFINSTIQLRGPQAANDRVVKSMQAVKVEYLTLLRTYIERSEDAQMVASQIVETLYEPVLGDFSRAVPLARLPEVLELFAAIVAKLKGSMSPGVHRILRATFAPTLEMIAPNFEDFPEMRVHFYSLLKQINQHCFVAFWSAPPEAQKQIIDSILWGIKHTQSNIAEISLEILSQILTNVAMNPQVAQQFYRAHLINITSDVLFCLTDRLHKSGFKLHATLLQTVFGIVQSGQVQVALFELAGGNATSAMPSSNTPPTAPLHLVPSQENVLRLRDYVTNMICEAFPNVARQVVLQFVEGCFEHRNTDSQLFKQHVRDFLIQLKEFSTEDNRELFKEEAEESRKALMAQRASVPGLVNDDMNEL